LSWLYFLGIRRGTSCVFGDQKRRRDAVQARSPLPGTAVTSRSGPAEPSRGTRKTSVKWGVHTAAYVCRICKIGNSEYFTILHISKGFTCFLYIFYIFCYIFYCIFCILYYIFCTSYSIFCILKWACSYSAYYNLPFQHIYSHILHILLHILHISLHILNILFHILHISFHILQISFHILHIFHIDSFLSCLVSALLSSGLMVLEAGHDCRMTNPPLPLRRLRRPGAGPPPGLGPGGAPGPHPSAPELVGRRPGVLASPDTRF
jgi:hypothetical protein